MFFPCRLREYGTKTMAIVGYARVSSIGQSLEVQLDRLSHCDKVYQDQCSGTTAARPAFQACLDFVREGDFLVVTRLDRLARSTFHLCQIADRLREKGVELQVLDQNIDTSDATGRLLFNMLGAIAQFETEIRTERQLEGIEKAKACGVAFGRKRRLSEQAVRELKRKRKAGVKIVDLMAEFGLSKTSTYRYLASNLHPSQKT